MNALIYPSRTSRLTTFFIYPPQKTFVLVKSRLPAYTYKYPYCTIAQLNLTSCIKAGSLNYSRQNKQRPALIYEQIGFLITNSEVWAVGIGR